MKKCGDMGFHGITVPERFGGLDLGYMKYIICAEEAARVAAGVGMSMGAHANLCINQLVRNASDEQNEKYLPDLLSGDKIGGLAMSETEAGSDVMSMRTTSVKNSFHLTKVSTAILLVSCTIIWSTNYLKEPIYT